jgi:hypothetical protein
MQEDHTLLYIQGDMHIVVSIMMQHLSEH